MRQQTDWTIQSVQKFGPERTRKLIEVYTRSGFLSAGVGAVLQRVAGAFQPEDTPARSQKIPPTTASHPVHTFAALNQAQKRAIMQQIIRGLQKSSASQDSHHG